MPPLDLQCGHCGATTPARENWRRCTAEGWPSLTGCSWRCLAVLVREYATREAKLPAFVPEPPRPPASPPPGRWHASGRTTTYDPSGSVFGG